MKQHLRTPLFCSALAALLILSLLVPPLCLLWEKIDIAFFRWINAPLAFHPHLRTFWALANHAAIDWIEDLCFLALYLIAIWRTPKYRRKQLSFQLLFSVLLTAFTILCINRLLCRDLLRLRRHSPTILLDHAVYITDYISWISVKVDSSKSFPGDHATTALMLAGTYAYFVRGKLGAIALALALFLCLPRLAVGAHWLSDIVVGSGTIVLLSLGNALPFVRRKSMQHTQSLASNS